MYDILFLTSQICDYNKKSDKFDKNYKTWLQMSLQIWNINNENLVRSSIEHTGKKKVAEKKKVILHEELRVITKLI